MKTFHILLASLASYFFLLSPSSAQTTFQKTYGGVWADIGQSVQQTNDGGFIIGGYTQSFGTGYYDLYLIRTDANGDTLWTSVISTPTTLTELGLSARQTTDGGFIITGRILDIVTSSDEAYLVKTDSLGNVLWTKTYGGDGEQTGYSVEQTTDQGFIIGGDYRNFINNDFDVYLVKTNETGDTLWCRVFGGVNDEHGNSAIQTADGGYIIAGSTNSVGAGMEDVLLLKTDSAGNSLWAKTYGGSGIDAAWSVQQSNDGGYIIGGTTTSFTPGGSNKVYLIKTDSNGDTLWTRIYAAGIGTFIGAYSVRQTTSGGFILAGITDGTGAGGYDFYLIRTDGNGNLIWSKTYGGTSGDFGQSVQETIDGGFIVAGYTQNFGAGADDVYLIKTDSMGNSGCNETNALTIEGSPATLVGSFVPAAVSLGIIGAPVPLLQRGGTITTLCTGNTGIIEVPDLHSIIVSPNPSPGNFTITFPDVIDRGEVQILNAYGIKIFSQNIHNTSNTEIHLKNITGGIYFVKIWNGEKYFTSKIVIQQN